MADAFAFTAPAELGPGTYHATIKSVEPVVITTQDGDKDLIRWTVEAVDDDGQVVELDTLSSRNMGARSKNMRFLAALGLKPSYDKPTPPEAIAGAPCMAVVGLDDNGYMTLEDLVAPVGRKSK